MEVGETVKFGFVSQDREGLMIEDRLGRAFLRSRYLKDREFEINLAYCGRFNFREKLHKNLLISSPAGSEIDYT